MKRIVSVAACLLGASLALAGCTSVNVKPLAADPGLQHLCIQENPRVIVPGFVGVLQEGIQRNGLTSEVFSGQRPAYCGYVLGYTALRSWDLTTYLSYAELWIDHDGSRVASAEYHLRGKGGLSLAKWGSVESKMAPVIDELLAGVDSRAPRQAHVSPREPQTVPAAPAPTTAVAVDASTSVIKAAVAVPAVTQADAGPALAYDGDPTDAARTLARIRNCTSDFRLFDGQEGRLIYSATCWDGRKLLVRCDAGMCSELR